MGRLRSAGVVLVVGAVLGHAASASALVPSTVRVNLTSSGAQLDFFSGSPSISADGRWVSFDSDDPSVVPADGNNARDVFLRDRSTGETRRISVRPDGTIVTVEAIRKGVVKRATVTRRGAGRVKAGTFSVPVVLNGVPRGARVRATVSLVDENTYATARLKGGVS